MPFLTVSRRSLVRLVFAGLVAGLGVISPASAGTVTFGQSDANSLSANLSLDLLGNTIATANISPQLGVSNSSPGPYSNSNTLTTANVSAGTFALPSTSFPVVSGQLLGINAIQLGSYITSNVDGLSGARTTDASNGLANLNFSLGSYSLLGGTPQSLLSITASAINAAASVTGDFGSLATSGSATVADLSIRYLGNEIFSANGSIAANTVINIAPGISLTLNEQIVGGDNISNASILTNFLRLSFDDAGLSIGNFGLATINGDLILGHAYAEQTAAVPEPASIVMASLGVVGLVGSQYRRNRRKAQDA